MTPETETKLKFGGWGVVAGAIALFVQQYASNPRRPAL